MVLGADGNLMSIRLRLLTGTSTGRAGGTETAEKKNCRGQEVTEDIFIELFHQWRHGRDSCISPTSTPLRKSKFRGRDSDVALSTS